MSSLSSGPSYKARYWLHHVLDFTRVHGGRKEANVGLVEFLNKNYRNLKEVWAEMGLDIDLEN
jgi:hypothetical protein